MRTTKELLALVEAAPDWQPEVDIHPGYRGAGDGCEAVWRAEVETTDPVGVGRWEDPEVDAIGEALAALLGALDRPTLRHLIAAADALESLALAAGLPATATPAEVVARVGEMREAAVAVVRCVGYDLTTARAIDRLRAALASEAGR